MVQNTVSTQHLVVEVIDQRQWAVRLHSEERSTGGALQEVLKVDSSRARPVLGVGELLGRRGNRVGLMCGRREVERRRWGWSGWAGVKV